jgi:ATP-dependent RNA helicase DDX18/HAS1
VLKGPALHRTAPGVRSKLVDCSAGTNDPPSSNPEVDEGFQRKGLALLRELEAEPASHTLIFCNTIESCRRVENFLHRRDRRGEAYEVRALYPAADWRRVPLFASDVAPCL